MNTDAPTRLRLHGLRTRLLWAVAGLAATLTLLLALALAALLKQQQTDQAGTVLQVLARSGAQQLADDVFERSQLVQVLAQSPDLWRDGLNSQAANALIARIPLIRPYSLWMGVADSKGLVVQSSGGLLQGRSVADTPWFIAGSRAITVSDVLPAKLLAPLLPTSTTGEPPQLVNFSAPIPANGQLLGVLSMHTNWDWAGETLQSLHSTLAAGSRVELFIFDRNGRLLHAPEGHYSATMVEALQSSQPRHPARLQRWTDSHSDFLTAIAPLPARNAVNDLGWYVVARQPAPTLSAFIQSLLPLVLSAALLAALLASAVLYWLTRRTLQELHLLTEAAQHIGNGESLAPLPLLHSSHELQQLSRALLNMPLQLPTGRTRMAQKSQDEAAPHADTDVLTGLLTPLGLAPLLHFAMALARRSGRPLCLMSLDIDHLLLASATSIEVRNTIVQDLARHLHARLRDADLEARWGETEFMVLLPDTPAEDVQRMALDILATVAQHNWPQVGTLTLSAGMTALRPTLQDGTEDTEAAMLQRCNEALQASRQAGGNRVHFQP